MIHLKVADIEPIPLKVSEVYIDGGGGDVPVYDGSYEVTPTEETQTLETSLKKMLRNVTINPISSQYIIPSGTVNINDIGTYDVSTYENAQVSIASAQGVNF